MKPPTRKPRKAVRTVTEKLRIEMTQSGLAGMIWVDRWPDHARISIPCTVTYKLPFARAAKGKKTK